MRWSLQCHLHLRSLGTQSQRTNMYLGHSDVTRDTRVIASLTRMIRNAPSHRAASRCMLILVLVGSDASCSYQSLPLAISHSLDSSTVLPKHAACRSMLQVGHWILKNAAHYMHALCTRGEAHSSRLCLAAIFLHKGTALLCSETKCCAPARQCSTVPGGPRKGEMGHPKIKLQNDP